MSRSILQILTVVAALVLVAGPAVAFTVFLKDGSTIVAGEQYRIEGDRIIITLQNGTETFLALDEVDLERTDEYNKVNISGAVLIEDGKVKALPSDRPAEKTTLRDLIVSGQAQPRIRPEARRENRVETAGPQRTTGGYLDLNSLRRQAYGDLEFMSSLRSFFTSQGLEAQIFRGSQGDRPLVQVVTSSESSVFKSLQVAAQAMAQLADSYGSRVANLELLLQTPRGTPAGQFVLTADLAEQINSNAVDVSVFYVENVQF